MILFSKLFLLHTIVVENTCDPIPNPPNGEYLPAEASSVGTELAIICDFGYHSSLPEPVLCDNTVDGDDAVWTGTPPVCGKNFYFGIPSSMSSNPV